YLDPPRIKVETEIVERQAGPPGGVGLLFFPGMMIMALLFTASGYSDDLWKERARGTMRRSITTPVRLEALLGGKLLAISAVFAAVSAASWLMGTVFFGAPVWPMPAGVVWLTIT